MQYPTRSVRDTLVFTVALFLGYTLMGVLSQQRVRDMLLDTVVLGI